MKSMYPADENGNLIYWVTECGEKIIREYPDGHTEAANEQETKLYNKQAAPAAPLMRVSGRNPGGSRRAEERRMKHMIYTVFPDDPDRLPQDFPTYEEAKAYGDEWEDEYIIESTDGECV